MAKQRMRFRDWYQKLGEPVPLGLVPQLLDIPRDEVKRAVKDGQLRVFTFRAETGRVYRMVPRIDLKYYGRNPLTQLQLAAAFRRLLAA